MRGYYTIRQEGRVVGRANNLLTDAATRALLRYLAGENESWAGAIAVGASDVAPAVTDKHLGFEFGRGKVVVRVSSLADSSVVVKATISDDIEGVIHELGLFSANNGVEEGDDQLLITDFVPDMMEVVNVSSVQSRIGREASLITTADGVEETAEFSGFMFDISVLGPEDRLILAYDATNVGNVEVRLMNSSTDYMSYSFTAQPGYNIEEWDITDLTTVGSGSILSTFTGIEVRATGAGGAGSLVLDGLRADDTDVFEEQVLVSRAVLAQPIIKTVTTDLEVEYTIQFDF